MGGSPAVGSDDPTPVENRGFFFDGVDDFMVIGGSMIPS